MSYAVPPQPTKPRPTVVTIAVALLWAVAAINLLAIGLYFVPTPELDRAVADFMNDHPELSGGGATALGDFLDIGLAVVVTAAFAILAIFVGKGSQPARITTWVLAGIVVLCQGCLIAGSLAVPALMDSATSSGNAEAEALVELARVVAENTPTWLTVVSVTLNVLGLLALISVIILLAVPASNDYFRKEEQVWVPPTASGGGFPQFPPPSIPQNPGAGQNPSSPPPPPPAQPPSSQS